MRKRGKDPEASSKLMFSYPGTTFVLFPRAVPQVLPEALQLAAAPEGAAGPQFTVQPAGGRQGPRQHGMAFLLLNLDHRHLHVFAHIPHEEICKEEPRNINTPTEICLDYTCPLFILPIPLPVVRKGQI